MIDPPPPTPEAPYVFRYARLVRIRWWLSTPTLLALLGWGTSYAVRGVTTSVSQPVLEALQNLWVPLWPLAFGLAALGLVVALVARRRIELAHVLTAAISAGYAAALLWASAVAGAGWATASGAVAVAVQSGVMALVYAKGR